MDGERSEVEVYLRALGRFIRCVDDECATPPDSPKDLTFEDQIFSGSAPRAFLFGFDRATPTEEHIPGVVDRLRSLVGLNATVPESEEATETCKDRDIRDLATVFCEVRYRTYIVTREKQEWCLSKAKRMVAEQVLISTFDSFDF